MQPDHKLPLSASIANLEAFFNSCPITPIHFVYFTCSNRKCIPHVKSFFREWHVVNKTVYSILMPNGWSYTYGLTDLQRLVYVDKSGEKERGNRSIIPRTQTQVTATVGDHITIGISPSKDPTDPLISTRKTYYTPMNTPNIQYERDDIKCNITLYAQSIDATQYTNDPLTIQIIQKITNVYKGRVTGGGAGHKISRKNPSLKLTYKGIGYDDNGFIDFLYETILSVVASRELGMENIAIIYDEDSYLDTDTNKYICIIYEYTVYEEEERVAIYHMDAIKAFTAYYTSITPEEKTTESEKTCAQEFREDIVQHIPQVVAV